MNFFKNLFGSKFKIEKIETHNYCAVYFCPSRGGIITSLVIKGKEVLYFDKETFKDLSQNVRGGIPILFPNAGAVSGDKEKLKNLKQHGFARNSNKWTFTKKSNGFIEKLVSDEETREVYPYDFKMSLACQIENDNSITITENVENLDSNYIPIAMGLHPYFKVKHSDKKDIIFNFKGGEIIKENFSVWSSGGTVYIDNPKINDDKAKLDIYIPSLGNLSLDVSKEYKMIWIWSKPGSDFICIEPMLRGLGGIMDDPQIIKPNGVFSSYININLDY